MGTLAGIRQNGIFFNHYVALKLDVRKEGIIR